MEKFTHPVPPLYNENSKVLILGSFPSPKSREAEFFYMHPQNRFWKVIYGIFDEQVSDSVEDRKKFVLEHNLAIWDVLHSCEIEGASDSSIKNIVVNDFSKIFSAARINAIFITGQTASSDGIIQLIKEHGNLFMSKVQQMLYCQSALFHLIYKDGVHIRDTDTIGNNI